MVWMAGGKAKLSRKHLMIMAKPRLGGRYSMSMSVLVLESSAAFRYLMMLAAGIRAASDRSTLRMSLAAWRCIWGSQSWRGPSRVASSS
jgi:hypothetical protein